MLRDYLKLLAVLGIMTGLVVGVFYLALPTPTLAGECPTGACCMTIRINADGTYTQTTYDCVTKQIIRVRVGLLAPKS